MKKQGFFSPEEKFSFTQDNFLFKNLEDHEIDKVKDQIFYVPMTKGDLVFESSDHANRFYLIVAGKIKIFQYSIEGKEQILYIYEEGEFIGGHNLIKEEDYQYNGMCIEDGILGIIEKTFFDDYLVKNPKILTSILKMSFKRIRLAENLIQRLTVASTDEKVAQLLIELIPYFGRDEDGKTIIQLSMTRKELASMVGLTRETLTRKLLDYQDKGILDLQGNSLVIINDLDSIKELAYNEEEQLKI